MIQSDNWLLENMIPFVLFITHFYVWEVFVLNHLLTPTLTNLFLLLSPALRFLHRKKYKNTTVHLQNGLFLCATSFKHVEGKKETYEPYLNSLPLAIRVPNFSQREFLSSIAYYGSRLIVPEKAGLNDILAYRIHTGSNPLTGMSELIRAFWCWFYYTITAVNQTLPVLLLRIEVVAYKIVIYSFPHIQSVSRLFHISCRRPWLRWTSGYLTQQFKTWRNSRMASTKTWTKETSTKETSPREFLRIMEPSTTRR